MKSFVRSMIVVALAAQVFTGCKNEPSTETLTAAMPAESASVTPNTTTATETTNEAAATTVNATTAITNAATSTAPATAAVTTNAKSFKDIVAAKQAESAATTNTPAATTAPAAATTADSGPTTSIKFDAMEYKFGKIKQDEKVTHVFKFTNTGKEPLIISNAKGSCGCTVPTYTKEPLAPGKTGEMKVEFDSKGKSGPQTKTVTITANTVPSTTVLKITGEVEAPEGN